MDSVNRNKKAIKKIMTVTVITIIITTIVSSYCAFPVVQYASKDVFSHIGSSVKMTVTSGLDYEAVPMEELKNSEKTQFNESLMLVNTDHPLSQGYEANIKEYEDTGIMITEPMLVHFDDLKKDITEKYNQTLYVSSDYRTAEDQERIKKEEGDTAQEAGCSEHQTGLALDVYVQYFGGETFIKSEAGRFVNENAYRYGFIIRYPYYGKMSTGISWEPWHIRYVGFPHAEIISRNRDTLEEYIESFEIGKFYEYDGYIISRQNKEDEIKLPKKYKSVEISPDNCGNWIVTVKV